MLSLSSSFKEIVLLTQKIYTLGDSTVGSFAPINSWPLNTILDQTAKLHLERIYPEGSPVGDREFGRQEFFTTLRFYLDPDLDQEQVITVVQVNGKQEKLVMGYEYFYSEVAKATGSRTFRTKPDCLLHHRLPIPQLFQ